MVVGFTVDAVVVSTLTCAEGNAVDVNDAAPDDPVVFALEDDGTAIFVSLGDSTVIVALGDTTDTITLKNPTVVVVALDSSTFDVVTAIATLLEDSAAELLPKQCAIERTVPLALKE